MSQIKRIIQIIELVKSKMKEKINQNRQLQKGQIF